MIVHRTPSRAAGMHRRELAGGNRGRLPHGLRQGARRGEKSRASGRRHFFSSLCFRLADYLKNFPQFERLGQKIKYSFAE